MKLAYKIFKRAALATAAAFLAVLAFVSFMGAYEPAAQNADAAIVLGAAINTPALYNRSLEGLNLYRQGKAEVLVLSGGKGAGRKISEAQYMQAVIESNYKGRVPVILEEDSRNTFENIKNSRKKIPEAESVFIVSDRFHLARAVLLAKRAGFDKVYWSAPGPYYYNELELSFYYFREAVAMMAYLPKFIFF